MFPRADLFYDSPLFVLISATHNHTLAGICAILNITAARPTRSVQSVSEYLSESFTELPVFIYHSEPVWKVGGRRKLCEPSVHERR